MRAFIIKLHIFILTMLCIGLPILAQETYWYQDSTIYDTVDYDVFKNTDGISFKLNYYLTEGYSTGDRYNYEIIILDSFMILNFNSPDNDDWNYVSYQKQLYIDDSTLSTVKSKIKSLNIGQKKTGFPRPQGSGYGADKLFIESENISVAGGTAFMCVGGEMSDTEWEQQILKEKEASTSISGDYETFFTYLKSLFPMLPTLLNDMNKY